MEILKQAGKLEKESHFGLIPAITYWKQLPMEQYYLYQKTKSMTGTQKDVGRNFMGTGWFIPEIMSSDHWEKYKLEQMSV